MHLRQHQGIEILREIYFIQQSGHHLIDYPTDIVLYLYFCQHKYKTHQGNLLQMYVSTKCIFREKIWCSFKQHEINIDFGFYVWSLIIFQNRNLITFVQKLRCILNASYMRVQPVSDCTLLSSAQLKLKSGFVSFPWSRALSLSLTWRHMQCLLITFALKIQSCVSRNPNQIWFCFISLISRALSLTYMATLAMFADCFCVKNAILCFKKSTFQSTFQHHLICGSSHYQIVLS